MLLTINICLKGTRDHIQRKYVRLLVKQNRMEYWAAILYDSNMHSTCFKMPVINLVLSQILAHSEKLLKFVFFPRGKDSQNINNTSYI